MTSPGPRPRAARTLLVVGILVATGWLLSPTTAGPASDADQGCVHSHGFWKTHPAAWPRDTLVLGNAANPQHTYTKTELLALLKSPSRGDASVILVHQLIAARLNVASGSNPGPIAGTLAAADVSLGGFSGKLPYRVKTSSPEGGEMVSAAEVLDRYNNGQIPGSCQAGNSPPTASAGADQTVTVETLVTLNGTASTDPDGDPLTYRWTLVSSPPGSAAALSDPAAVMPTLVVDRPGTYDVELVVHDGTVASAPDLVRISTINSRPIARAGPDQTTIATGSTVRLDGSASSDVDGDVLSFSWSLASRPPGSTATLSGPTTAVPTFVADVFGDYVVELVVSDGVLASAADRVNVSTVNSPPVASAGPDQTAFVTDTVTLDGGGSTDVDGNPLTFRWSFTTRPAGSAAALSDPAALTPSFALDVAGEYVVQLIVNDGAVDSRPDTVTISTRNSPPVANAGPDQTVFVGDTAQLDGSRSTDVDGNALTYAWSLTTRPPGSAAALSEATAVRPTFGIDEPGLYVAQLVVHDGTVSSAADTVAISTENRPPIAGAGPDQTVPPGGTAQLDGSASRDLDGDDLTFQWSLTTVPAGSAATLSSTTVPNPTLTTDLSGSYVAQLIVGDGQLASAPDTVTVTTQNATPIADAGPDQSVITGARVQLDGSASRDPDGTALLHFWSLLSRPTGSTASLSDTSIVNPTFVADRAGTYVAQLIVGDGVLVSVPDTVTITVQDGADLRVSFTLAPTTQAVGAFVALRVSVTNLGPASVTGATVSFRVPAGYAVESTAVGSVGSYDSTTGIWTTGPIGPPFSAQITFGTRINATGPYDLTATVTGSSHLDPNAANNTATVLFTPNANADLSISFNPFNTPSGTLAYGANTGLIVDARNNGPASAFGVTMHVQIPPGYTISSAFVPGLGSFDTATRVLTIGTLPLGGAAVFLTLTVNTAPGPLNLSATVTGSQPDPNLANNTVTAPPANRLPLAEAGADQSVATGTPVALDGRASSDPDGDAVTFQWDFALRPADSTATLTGATTATPSFTPDVPGVYRARLRLADSRGTAGAADTVTITADGFSRAPIMLSSPVTVGAVGQPYAYDVNAVDQDGGDTLTFSLTGAPAGMTIDPATGLIQWTPADAQSGPQAVAVRAQDQRGLFAEQTFNVQVSSATNRAPVAADDAYEVRAGEALSVNAPGVLGNDTDGDGAPLTAVLRSAPVNGTVVLNPDGSFTFTPHGLREGDLVTAENVNLATAVSGVVVEAPGQLQGTIPVFAADDDLSTPRRSNHVIFPSTDVVFPTDVTVTELRIFGNRDQFLAALSASEGFFQLLDATGAELFNSGIVALPPPARDARVPVPAFFQRSTNIARTIPGVIHRASSNNSGTTAVGRAFDGDMTTAWLKQSNAPLPQFVEVEFPADVVVHRVRALGPRGNFRNNVFLTIAVQAFDAAGHVLFDSGNTGVPVDAPDATVELGGAAGVAGVRRVRVVGTASNSSVPGFGEVEVLGAETSTVPLNDRVRRARFTITAAASAGAGESGFADFKVIGSAVIRRQRVAEPNLGQLLPTVVRASGAVGFNTPEGVADDNPATNWYADTHAAFVELVFPVEVTVTQFSTVSPTRTPAGFPPQIGIDCHGRFTLHGSDGAIRFDSGLVNVPLGLGSAFTLPVPSVTGVTSARYTATSCDPTKFGPGFSEFGVLGSAPVTTPAFGLARSFQGLAGRRAHSTPLVVNLTDDNLDGVIDTRDVPDIVVPVDTPGDPLTGEIKVLSGDDGRELLTLGGPNLVSPWAEAAVGDIDGDGLPDIVAVHSDGNHLIAFGHTGAQKWTSDANPMPRFTLAEGSTVIGGTLAIANLDATGLPEIVVGASVFDATGRLIGDGRTLGGTTGGTGLRSAVSAIVDLDVDGIPELVAGPTAYRLVNGQLTKAWQRTDLPDGFVGIGNFDDDPFPEIVIVANGHVYLLNHDGTDAEVWNPPTHAPVPLPGGGQGGAPTVADLDGDGVPEIGVAGAANYVVLNRDGSVRWTSVISDRSSNSTGSTVFDFDGDGSVEIVYRDERFLRVYRGTDGMLLAKTPIESSTWAELPVVADVDNDGHADVVVTSDLPGGGSSGATGVHVFRDVANQWARTRRIWNQHSYHVTNVNEDGTIPVVETPNWLVPGLNNFRLNAFLPGEGTDGADSFTYVATDGLLESSLATVQITVRAQNSAPRITSTAITTAATGVAYVYAAQATDPDAGDVLTFSLPTAPAGMTIESASGVIRWTPTPAQGGRRDVVVKVHDARGLFVLQGYAVEVGAPVTVPDVVGQPQAAAAVAITGANLAVGAVGTRRSATTAAGAVISQSPAGGVLAARGSPVNLVVSTGPPPVGTVPDVVGQLQAAAAADIEAAGFVAGPVTGQHSAAVPLGIVLTQSPAGGTVAPGGSAVSLVVSLGVSPADRDLDGDGFTPAQGDCDDANPNVRPGAADTPGDGIDQNCNGRDSVAGDDTPPLAAIESPAEDAVVTMPTDIVGTATDENFLRYTLEVAPAGDTTFRVIGGGTTPVVSGVLGRLDPTLLENGLYRVRLTSGDVNGQTSTVERAYRVAGDAKIGVVALSFVDLQVPVSGIPIRVVRSYDSRVKTQRDFGVGWSLDVKTGTYRNNRRPGDGWTVTRAPGPFGLPCSVVTELASHLTEVRLSDREAYLFRPRLADLAAVVGGCVGRVTYEFIDGPLPGATLAVLGNADIIYTSGDQLTEFDGTDDTGLVFDPRQVRLTTIDGRVVDFDRATGVIRIQDNNGNALSITAAGIVHGSGKSVAFTRDDAGRIVRITDPNNHRLEYAYDPRGDLVAFTDQAGHRTTFTYDDGHLLLEVHDPLGNRAFRGEYDADGRLTAMIDARGRRIEFARDLAAREEVVTDARGNVTRLAYDELGHVSSEQRAVTIEGVQVLTTATFTHDRFGNELVVVDPDGQRIESTYDHERLLDQVVDPQGLALTTRRTYDGGSRLLSITDPTGVRTAVAYDGRGNLRQWNAASGDTLRMEHEAQGRPTLMADSAGTATRLTYDAAGNAVRVEQTDGAGTLLSRRESTYDANGNRLSETVFRTVDGVLQGFMTTFTYDALNRVVAVRDPAGHVSRTEYNALGLVAAEIDGLGRRTAYTYDELGALTRTDFPDGTFEAREYDAAGNLIRLTDPAGRSTVIDHDELDRAVRTVHPDGTSERRVYSPGGRTVALIDRRGHGTDFAHDSAGRRLRTIFPEIFDSLSGVAGRPEQRRELDAAGRPVAEVDASGRRTEYTRDAAGRIVRTTYADGTSRELSYTAQGRIAQTRDEAGRVTAFEYDALGRLAAVVDPAGGRTAFGYDESGNRLTQTDALGRTTRFRYNALNRLSERTLPGGQRETFEYDAVGNLTAHVDFNGHRTDHAYDAMNRLVRSAFHDGSETSSTYTSAGQRRTVTDAGGPTSYEYDAAGRLARVTHPGGEAVTYAYDAGGAVGQVSSPAAAVDYEYDALGRLVRASAPAGETRYARDAVGNVVEITRPNGIVTRRRHDPRHRLADVRHVRGSELVGAFTYQLSPTGRRLRVTEADGSEEAYTYDPLDRLVSETRTGAHPRSTTYEYDAVGNRRRTVRDGAPTTNAYDVNDRLLSAGATEYAYDVNGNLLSATTGGSTTAYTWDPQNRLIRVTGPAGSVEFTYDADGHRVARRAGAEVTRYLVDTNSVTGFAQVLEERDGAGSLLAHHTYGADLYATTRAGTSSFYLTDALGSVRLLTDATGEVTDRYDYDADGNPALTLGSTPNAYRFAGEQLESALGLYYLRARWMDPTTGRFVSRDPFPGVAEDPRTLHPYLYANADPVNTIDPSGYFSMTEQQGVVSIMGQLARTGLTRFAAFGRRVETAKDLFELAYTIGHELIPLLMSISEAPTLGLAGTSGAPGSGVGAGRRRPGLGDLSIDDVARVGGFFGVSFEDAASTLGNNLDGIAMGVLRHWLVPLTDMSARDIAAFLMYLPNPAAVSGREVFLPTGIRITIQGRRIPVRMVLGGSDGGRLVGAGMRLAPGGSVRGVTCRNCLVWAMDYMPWLGIAREGANYGRGRGVAGDAAWPAHPYFFRVLYPSAANP